MNGRDGRGFLAGGGEMGALMRSHHWSATSLGEPDLWPQALRTAVRLLLNTGHPMYVFWGPELLCFYNDAYRASIGPERHPGSLGKPAIDVWAEIWDVIGPQIDQVMTGLGATWHRNQLLPITRNGRREEVYWTYSYGPIDDDGAANGIGGVLVVCTETTDTVMAERRRAEEIARQRRMFEQAPGFIIVMRGPGHVVEFVNDAHRRLFGSGGWVGRTIRDAFPALADQGFFELLDGVLASGETYRAEGASVRFNRPGESIDETRFLDFVYAPLLGDAGDVVGIFCEGFDVTDRVTLQAGLREGDATLRFDEERRRLATEASEVGLWDVDVATDTLFWPPRVKAMFGISPDVSVSMADFFAGLHPEDRDRTAASYAAAADPARRLDYDVEYRTIGKEDGIVRWVAARGRGVFDADGRCVRMIGTAIDVTARKDADRRLKESEANLAETLATLDALVASAPIGFAFFDPQRRYVRVNAVLAGITGVAVDAHIGRTIEEITPAIAPAVTPMIEAVIASGRALEAVEIGGTPPSSPGERRTWLTSFFPVFGEGGGVAFVGATATDITARKRAEAAVRDLNESLAAKVEERTAERDRLWQNSRDLQVVIDFDGVFHAVSPAVKAVLGWDAGEMIGHSAFEFVLEEDQAATHGALVHAIGNPLPAFENRYRHKDGGFRWISWVAAPEENLVYASGRDVTSEKQAASALAVAEEALRHSQKMEAVGQLTGGVAHDFNNLLTIIRSSVDLLKRPGLGEDRRGRYIEAISDTTDRAAKLTGQLLAFARRQALQPEVFDVVRSVTAIGDMVRTLTGSRIDIGVRVCDDPCLVDTDRSQLDTALVNLAVNARDAMDGEGTLTISVRTATAIPALRGQPAVEGEFVTVSVADTGTGIAPDHLDRIFEPFFTTKGIGQGTGLGLSQVFGFVKQAGGEVAVESELGRGTTFVLYLPKVHDEVRGDGIPSGNQKALVDGHGTCVLVVEDNDDVGSFATQTLSELGYMAVMVGNAETALKQLETAADRFDVVFTDVVMPGMDGVDLGREIRRLHPELPVVLTSGYSHVLASTGSHGFELLHKPYSIEQLSRVLQKAAQWRRLKRVLEG